MSSPIQTHLNSYFKGLLEHIDTESPRLLIEGKLIRMVGLTLEAVGCQALIGECCLIIPRDGQSIEAEVVGFDDQKTYLMPIGEIKGLSLGARVIPTGKNIRATVSDHLLGRVIDGSGNPLDGLPKLISKKARSLNGRRLNPLERDPITEPMDVGIAAINSLLTIGRGQRIGLFAGSGVGKSVLLGMMTKHAEADVVVVGLIGERGREVKEFIEEILSTEARERAVIIAAPADSPPLSRLHGCMLAHSIAEYFRDQGKQVLLLMDSLTRFAQAQREIALAIGEPPATKGYPPSVFAKLPHLVERAGNGSRAQGQGGITAFYTVLMEGDDDNDPVADAARAVLDGHILLSRELAGSGHYPAIDVSRSISRVMASVTTEPHRAMAQRLRHFYTLYQENKDLINIGAYVVGSDPQVDQAIALIPQIKQLLQQAIDEKRDFNTTLDMMQAVLSGLEVNKAPTTPLPNANPLLPGNPS